MKSMQASQRLLVEQNIRYSRKAGSRGFLDRYRTASAEGRAAPLILIHGGGWSSLSKERFAPIARWIAIRYQLDVWCPNYRLLPHSAWPAPLIDCQAAAEFVRRMSGNEQICLAGGSAGGHLALLTGFELPRQQILGILSYGGPTVLEQRGRPVRPTFRPESIQRLFHGSLITGRANERLCPARHPSPGPPLALVHSTGDKLVMPSHAQLMRHRYRQIDAPCRYFPFSGYGIHHGGWALRTKKGAAPALAQPFKAALHSALRFLYKSDLPHETSS